MAKYQCKTQSAIPTDEGATTATAKSAGGRLGNSATRQQNKAIGDYLQQKGWTVTGGGGQVKEEYLPPLSGKGRAGSNYIDITATKTTSHGEVTIRINTVDTYASGLSTAREQAAAYVNFDILDYVVPTLLKGQDYAFFAKLVFIIFLAIVTLCIYGIKSDLKSLQ